MSATKTLALAFASTLALVGSALSVESEGEAWIIDPGPKGMMHMRFTTEGLNAFMQQKPKQLPAGTMIVHSGGKFYVLEDSKGTLYQQWRDRMIQGM